MKTLALVFTALALIAGALGAILFGCGLIDSMSNHPSAAGEMVSGGALVFGGLFLFALALLAEIAHNTRK